MELGVAMWVVWLVVMLILLAAEFMSTGILPIFFAIGAAVAGVVSLVITNVPIQLGIFAAVSLITVLTGRDFLIKTLKIHQEVRPSTVDALLGKTGIVTKLITADAAGLVKVDGDNWTAKSVDGTAIAAGVRVQVKAVEGVKLLVTRVEE